MMQDAFRCLRSGVRSVESSPTDRSVLCLPQPTPLRCRRFCLRGSAWQLASEAVTASRRLREMHAVMDHRTYCSLPGPVCSILLRGAVHPLVSAYSIAKDMEPLHMRWRTAVIHSEAGAINITHIGPTGIALRSRTRGDVPLMEEERPVRMRNYASETLEASVTSEDSWPATGSRLWRPSSDRPRAAALSRRKAVTEHIVGSETVRFPG